MWNSPDWKRAPAIEGIFFLLPNLIYLPGIGGEGVVIMLIEREREYARDRAHRVPGEDKRFADARRTDPGGAEKFVAILVTVQIGEGNLVGQAGREKQGVNSGHPLVVISGENDGGLLQFFKTHSRLEVVLVITLEQVSLPHILVLRLQEDRVPRCELIFHFRIRF